MPTIIQTLAAGLGDWPVGAIGLVDFARFDRLPRTTRVRIHQIAWFCEATAAPPPVTRVTIGLEEFPSVSPSRRIILVDAIGGTGTDPVRFDDSASVVLCSQIVERSRNAGFFDPDVLHHWRLFCETAGLAADVESSLIMDFDLEPFPDTTDRDGSIEQ